MMKKIAVNAFTSLSVGASPSGLYLFVEDGDGIESILMDIPGAEALLLELATAVSEARRTASLPPEGALLSVGVGSDTVEIRMSSRRTHLGVYARLGRSATLEHIDALQQAVALLPVGVG